MLLKKEKTEKRCGLSESNQRQMTLSVVYAQTISMPVRARASLFMYVYPAELIKSELGWEKMNLKKNHPPKVHYPLGKRIHVEMITIMHIAL